MPEIELSIMSSGGAFQSSLETLLQQFEAQTGIHVALRPLDWTTGWSDMLKFVFAGRGPAVSEVGDTWVASLALMNALRPFGERDVAALGGQTAFLPAAWHSTKLPGNDTVWTIPWFVETRAIYYRRDLLSQAGVDESTAFLTPAHLEQTLERLQASGVPIPWVVTTRSGVDLLHNLTSWIWGAGGDYIDPSHQRLTFADEPALAGIRAYYNLHRFLTPQVYDVGVSEADYLFAQGQAAVTLTGPWLAFSPATSRAPNLLEKVGITLPPGVPCSLGSHLVIWNYVPPRQEKMAVELLRFLTSQEVQHTGSQLLGLLPARLNTLSTPPFSDHPHYQAFVRGLKSGRSFPVVRLWAVVEEQLSAAFGKLWATILSTPNPDLDALIRAELIPLAERLNQRLQQ